MVTKAVVALHNFLMTKNNINSSRYCPQTFIDRDGPNGPSLGERRRDKQDCANLLPMQMTGSNNYSRNAASGRDRLKSYFNNEGAVDWQWGMVNSTANRDDTSLDES